MGYRLKSLLVIICLLGLLGLFFLFWPWSLRDNAIKPIANNSEKVTVTTPFFTPKLIGDNKLYLNRLLRFSVLYPKDFIITEYGQGNTSTMVFESADGIKGFQVFVVPYNEPQVSAERFKLDIPSGVREGEVEVIIGGVRGTMFYSQNAILGETREVWFINQGFLYEVTARKELDSWLADIMKSWNFLQTEV
ncbi:MAG: hypothetical protein AAB677_02785 [Patescibacteria group bacterium]